jgi:OOP family OmpA-OmpF porin
MRVLAVCAVLATVLLSGCADYNAGAQVVSKLDQTGGVTTHAIRYVPNSADLDSKSKPVLDDMVQYLKNHPTVHLGVFDYTNSINGAGLDLPLSQKRAEAVKAYIVAAGIDPSRLAAMH